MRQLFLALLLSACVDPCSLFHDSPTRHVDGGADSTLAQPPDAHLNQPDAFQQVPDASVSPDASIPTSDAGTQYCYNPAPTYNECSWCSSVPIDPTSALSAHDACSSCLGVECMPCNWDGTIVWSTGRDSQGNCSNTYRMFLCNGAWAGRIFSTVCPGQYPTTYCQVGRFAP